MFFQDVQAEFQDQEFYRNQRKHSQNLGWDSTHYHTDDKVFEAFIESRVAFFHTGDFSKVESLCLPKLAAMAGSAFHQASGAGKFSTGIFISGQRFQQPGGLLLKNRVSSEPLNGDIRQITSV